jgi:hypothetical protein
MKYLLICIALLTVGCKTSNSNIKYSVFPIEPNWEAYTRPPILESTSLPDGKNNYIVSDELIKKSIQQTRYIERVKDWRAINRVP